MKRHLPFMLLLVVGVIYRVWFSSLAVSTLLWDMETYHKMALDFLSGKIVADCCLKNAGYPAFLAGIYSLFGTGNLVPVRAAQVILDLTAGVFIFLSLRRIDKRASWWVIILFIFNPWTVSLTGFILPESVSIFFVSLLAFLAGSRKFKEKWVYWTLFGGGLGLLAFVRLSLVPFAYICIASLTVFAFSKRNRILFLLTCTAGFVIFSSYSIFSYYKTFGIASLSAPYTMRWGLLYLNFFYTRPYPELDFYVVHPEFTRMAIEFDQTPIEEKHEWEQKYRRLFWQKFSGEWTIFLRNVARNAFWIWDKEHLFMYNDPFYPGDRWPVRMTNWAVLSLFVFGLMSYLGGIRNNWRNPLAILTASLFLTISMLFPLVSNESRHSLVFYPLAFLWAGYGISRLV